MSSSIVSTITLSPSRAAPRFALLWGALLFAIPAAAVDASWTLWSQAVRPFGFRLFLSTLPAHAVFATLLALVFLLLSTLVRTVLGRRPPARSLSAGFAVAGGGYLFLLGGLQLLAGDIKNAQDLERLLGPTTLGLLLVLAAASLALALGLDWLGRSESLARVPLAGRPGPILALELLGAALFFGLVLQLRTSGLAASPLPAPRAYQVDQVRNVVWIVMDTTRRDRLSIYDPELGTTPSLERLAAEGTVFEAASSPAPYTLTSHASMLTGCLPSRHWTNRWTRRLSRSVYTLPEVMRKAGMRTSAFVATHVLSSETGLNRGFDHYDDLVDPELCYTSIWDLVHNAQGLLTHLVSRLRNDGRPHWIEDHTRSAAVQNERIFAWLDEHAAEPFFLFVNYYDAHWPYLPEEPFRSRFAVDYSGPMTGFAHRDDDFEEGYELTEADDRYLLSLYDGEIAYLDHQISRLLDHLRSLGQLERTMIVVTSDHGEYFGERELYGHSELYEPVIAVPLLLWLPGVVPAGLRVGAPVELTDVAPTILEIAGLVVPSATQGESLLPVMKGEQASRAPVVAEDFFQFGKVLKMARLDYLKLIRGFHPKWETEELYDLEVDPGETVNLLEGDAGESALGLSDVIERLRAAIPASFAPDSTAATDRKTYDAERALGYTE